MLNSGNSAIGTSSAAAVTLIACGGQSFSRTVIYNTGTVAGQFSIDNGSTWGFLPASTASNPGYVEVWHRASGDVLIRRNGAQDLTGVWGFVNDVNIEA